MEFLRTLFVLGVGETELWAPFVLRVAWGFGLLAHGLPKWKNYQQFSGYVTSLKWPLPKLFARLAMFAETVGGVLLILGLFVKPVAAILVIYYLLVILTAHRGQKFVDGWELPFLYFAAALALWVLNDPGVFALDSLLAR